MLESILNPLSIEDVMAKADAAKDKYVTAQKEFYELLMYLDQTKRYKELKAYRNASFDVFLRNRYNMTWKTYSETRVVLFEFEEEAEKHGAGFVRSTIKKAGKLKAKEALKEVDEAQTKRKKPLKVSDKQKIVEKYTLPKSPTATKREQPRTDWEFAFKQEHKRAAAMQSERDEFKQQVEMLVKRNTELTSTNQKLQKNLNRERNMRKELESLNYALHEEMEKLKEANESLRRANSFVPPIEIRNHHRHVSA
jgi:predicted RNase H-like nuclease (RuvC/YqgF family)